MKTLKHLLTGAILTVYKETKQTLYCKVTNVDNVLDGRLKLGQKIKTKPQLVGRNYVEI